MKNATRQSLSQPEVRLWLAVIAKAVQDILNAKLMLADVPAKELDTAYQFVRYYPGIAQRIARLESPDEVRRWLREIEGRLKEV